MPSTLRGFFIVASAAAIVIARPPAAIRAVEPGLLVAPSRAELVHRWDLNKDGTIDEAEAEVARAKMRRERMEIQQKSATKKPLVPSEKPADDPLKTGLPNGDPLGEAFRPPAPSEPQTATKKTPPSPTTPPRNLNAGRPRNDDRSMPGDAATRGPNGRRPLPGGPGGNGATGGPESGGIITGGVRAGAPALRPGYGAGGPKVDLNAGRLPAGLPAAKGMGPQVGSAPFRGMIPGNGPQGMGQRGSTSQPRPALMPSSSGRISAEDIGAP